MWKVGRVGRCHGKFRGGNGDLRGCSSACTSGVRKLVGFWDYPKIGNFVGAERNLYSRRVEFRGDGLRAVRRWGKNSTSGSCLAGVTDFFLW